MYYYANELVEQLKHSEHIVIYGARTVAGEVANCLMGAPYFLEISNFMVSDLAGNPKNLLGIPVIDIESGKRIYKNAVILVAVMEKYADEIVKKLRSEGFPNLILLTFESDLWSAIRGNYYQELRLTQGTKYLTLEDEIKKVATWDNRDKDSVKVYMAKCCVDRQLQADMRKYEWETPIQVGAALTDQRIAEICDNQGENISHKNREFCELTALYWIWKNDRSKYAGLCHYRRHFNMDAEMLCRIVCSDIDVVVTIPILNFPNVRSIYIQDHSESDWEIMKGVVQTIQPEYADTLNEFQYGVFYYGYNMFIARKEILDDYCSWLFPILEYCEKECGPKNDRYQNRYIGFLAERLMSVYFLHNENRYKIVHATKTFLEK